MSYSNLSVESAELQNDLDSDYQESPDEMRWRAEKREAMRKNLLNGGKVWINGREQTLDELVKNSESSRSSTLHWALAIYCDSLVYKDWE